VARRILPKSAQKVVDEKRASGAITATPFFFARHTIHLPASRNSNPPSVIGLSLDTATASARVRSLAQPPFRVFRLS
jgi:hypothetical protein